MGITEQQVSDFVRKSCALVDGQPLDYISITVNSATSRRSFTEHAKVQVGADKTPNQVASEVWEHVDNILASATEERRSECTVRMHLYRAKATAGSRSFSTPLAPHVDASDDGESADGGNMAGALVAGMRELRMTVNKLVDSHQVMATEGWRLAADAIKAERALLKENTELQIALAVSDDDKPDEMKQIAVKAASEFIEFTKLRAIHKMQADAQTQLAGQSQSTQAKDSPSE